jgi:lipid-A-disaccharide synthase
MKLKFASMVNVILDRMVEPEMLQGNCQPTRLAPEVVRILTDKDARADQVAASGIISAALTPPGSSPSAAAATAVLNIISKRHAGA